MAEALMAERYGRIFARARMLAGGDDAAADLVQEALIATFKRPRRFASIDHAEAYVRRAVVTQFLNEQRRQGRAKTREHSAASSVAVADHSSSVVDRVDLAGAVAQLPPRVRACVVLRFMEDMSVADTAQALGLSEGAVKRYVSDGVAVLGAVLGLSDDDADAVRVDVRTTEGGL